LLAPPLLRSEWFRNGGHVDVIARILLKGQSGPINGVTYGEGFMLPLEETYDDEQLASVINFIGQRWNDWKVPVEAAEIARVRQEIAARKTPFSHEELKEIARPKRPAR
jgi:mono/diheme cytochrome c family protein